MADSRGRVFKGRTPEQRRRNAEAVVRWQKKNPEAVKAIMQRAMKKSNVRRKDVIRAHMLRKKYKLTPEQYDEALLFQGGTCLICRSKPNRARLCVDHDHKTGVVRGLLCSGCNAALGLLKEDTNLLRRAADYLEQKL